MIIYFSGNGNSKSIAVTLSQKLNTELLELQHGLLTKPENQEINNDNKPIVWIFPVYSWGIPKVIVNFIEKCRIKNANEVNHHLVVTCGDDTGLTAKQWRRLIERKGWTHSSASSVIMPNTYVFMKGFDTDTPQVEKEKIVNSQTRLNQIYKRIITQCDNDDMTQGNFAWIKSNIIYPWFNRFAMSSKPFHTNSKCTSCCKCSRNCPMDNITMIEGTPQWSNNCAMCLRCYHQCPTHAIEYGRTTRNKHQYKGPQPQE